MINVVAEIMKSLSPPKVGSRPKTQDEKESPPIIKHKDPLCYKYCVDTHKYNVIGTIVNDEIVFGEVYPLQDNHIPPKRSVYDARAYQYTFFINEDNNFKTFIPKNVSQQVRVNSETNYVVGYMKDDNVIYYGQCLIGE